MSEVKETALEVPTNLADLFDAEIIRRAGLYADRAKGATEFWDRHPDKPDDLDGALSLLAQLRAINADRLEDGGRVYSGSAWVLSDVADGVLEALVEEAGNVTTVSPVDYRKVSDQAELVSSWAKVCERIDLTYREAVA
jgi:hypothetical protein